MYTGNDGLFHKIEGANVVIRKGAIYKQKPVYRRGRLLFVSEGGGYLALRKEGTTGKPDISWDWIEGVQYRKVEGVMQNIEQVEV